MTYPTPDHLKALTEYLSAYVMEEIGNTTIALPLFEQIQAMLAGTLKNGIKAFCHGASPTDLRYEVDVIADNADKPIVFEQWSVNYIKAALREESWNSEALPTLYKIDEAQLRELLKHCAAKRCSLYSDCEGPLYVLEEIAEVYFKKQR